MPFNQRFLQVMCFPILHMRSYSLPSAVDLLPEMPEVPAAVEAMLSEKQTSPCPERPNSSLGRKRPASSMQRELTALTSDEGVQGAADVDFRKKRRTAAITSELRQKQGKRQLGNFWKCGYSLLS